MAGIIGRLLEGGEAMASNPSQRTLWAPLLSLADAHTEGLAGIFGHTGWEGAR